MSENKPANLRLYEAFYTRKSTPTLNSRGRNVVNSQTFYFSILQTILKHFQRSFVERHSIIRALYSIHSIYLQLSYISHIFYTFHPTPFELRINIARAEHFLIPDDAVDRRKLGFWILLFLNSSLRPHQNSFIYFNFAAEGQHEQIIETESSLWRSTCICKRKIHLLLPKHFLVYSQTLHIGVA